MNKCLDYIVLGDKRLIVAYLAGKIWLTDILDFQNLMITSQEFNPNYNFLVDMRDADLQLKEDDVIRHLDYLRKIEVQFIARRKAAYITRTPEQVVITSLYEMLNKDFPIQIKPVSTLYAASKWLGLNQDNNQELAEILANFRSGVVNTTAI